MVQGRIDAVGEKAEEEQTIVSYIHMRIFFADTAPLLLPCSSSIAASKAAAGQILSAALQITANAHAKRRKRSQCRGHVVTECNKSNLQIGSLQIDVHEPPVRLSRALRGSDKHTFTRSAFKTRLALRSKSATSLGNTHAIACKRRYLKCCLPALSYSFSRFTKAVDTCIFFSLI
jgi:hypothetical protein